MEIWEEEYSVLTGMKEEIPKRFSYKWTLQNFKKYNDMATGKSIDSPLFGTSNFQHCLKIFPNGVGSLNFITIALLQTGEKETLSDINFFILDNTLQLQNKKKAIPLGTMFFGCIDFIGKADLDDSTLKLMNGNDFTVVCTFTKYQPSENIRSDSELECKKCRNKASLSNDFEKLLQNKSSTDVTLVVNDKKIYAHKVILIARSPVFAAMLQNDMEEKMKSEIVIKDFGADIISEMIQFMYTEKVSNIKDHFQDLLCLANKYDIRGLRLICEDFMLNELTIENVIEVFMLDESQNCGALRSKLLKFIIRNVTAIIRISQFESRKKDLPSWLLDVIKAVA